MSGSHSSKIFARALSPLLKVGREIMIMTTTTSTRYWRLIATALSVKLAKITFFRLPGALARARVNVRIASGANEYATNWVYAPPITSLYKNGEKA